jgi:hypothetical protein
MNFKCSCCGKRLKEPGALLFSPQTKNDCCGVLNDQTFKCYKYHICIDCFKDIKLEYITNSHKDE